jgi:3-hydroxymyristoyl/3-hydroxydecanoyl-(acyl carrier protein) dehydratase
LAGLAVTDDHRRQLALAGAEVVDLTARPARFCGGPLHLAAPMLLMLDRAVHVVGGGAAGLGVVHGEKTVDPAEWFFKAHFFQDPVQPGSLGIEALLQLLQFFMLDTGIADGIVDPRFEPMMLDAPMTWKYRGQVTPANTTIVTVMEITEVGRDDRGPFVIGAGSLWCDGLRIYEVSNMGMRVVTAPATQHAGTSVELARADVTRAVREWWKRDRAAPDRWLGDDLISGFIETYLNRVVVDGVDEA